MSNTVLVIRILSYLCGYCENNKRNAELLKVAVAFGLGALRKANNNGRQIIIERSLLPMLMYHYEITRNLADLDVAVEHARSMLAQIERIYAYFQISTDWKEFALGYLISLLRHRCHDHGRIQDIDEAIKLQQDTDLDHNNLPFSLSRLIEYRYAKTRNDSDLQRVIETARQSLQETLLEPDRGHVAAQKRALLMYQLSYNLCDMESSRDSESCLDEALMWIAQALNIEGITDPDRGRYLSQQAKVFIHRFDSINGSIVDIEKSVESAEAALALPALEADHTQFRQLITAVGAYGRRCMARGELFDLKKSIEYAREAVKMVANESIELQQEAREALVAVSYAQLYQIHDKETFQEAEMMARQLIEVSPNKRYYFYLSSLLLLECSNNRNSPRLQEAIRMAEKTVALCQEDKTLYPISLVNLGRLLAYEKGGEKQLERIAECFLDAIEAVKHRGFIGNIAGLEINYASVLQTMCSVMRDDEYGAERKADYRDKAFEIFMRYAKDSRVGFRACMECASRVLPDLDRMGRVQEAADMSKLAMDLLPKVCRRYMRHKQLKSVAQDTWLIAAIAASFSFKENGTARALETLELGRGITHGYKTDNRCYIKSLRCTNEVLSRRFETLCAQLDADPFDEYQKAAWTKGYQQKTTPMQTTLSMRRDIEQNMEECINEIRLVPGYERFLMPMQIENLQDIASGLAGEGVIILVNITPIGLDALILSSFEPRHVYLGRKIPKSVAEVALKKFPDPLSTGPSMVRDAVVKTDDTREFTLRRISENEKDETTILCADLWEFCVRPVLDVLEGMKMGDSVKSARLPRVWWIGCGLASSLPFHAAGSDFSANSRENAYSRVVSSYTPTIKTLEYARSRPALSPDEDSILLVSMPTTPGKGDLPGVKREQETIHRVCSGSSYHIKDMCQPAAADVTAALSRCALVHFSCHGSSDPDDPWKSHLMLQKSPPGSTGPPILDKLSIDDLRRGVGTGNQNDKRPWLAVLAACRTAEVRALQYEDEELHLAGTFLAAGFANIVATLWPVDDDACVSVSGAFYQALVTATEEKKMNTERRTGCDRYEDDAFKGRVVAEALHQAVKQLRESGCSPSVWAPFVHFGA